MANFQCLDLVPTSNGFSGLNWLDILSLEFFVSNNDMLKLVSSEVLAGHKWSMLLDSPSG
ncbi:unnamed protein product [Leptidea sinapis]|uniref:Uncharacterized protein n=1 Tax=Leptidea sinapis TaxID=189913 RepID=A0A5E4QHW1_9NEOP|nr:unnamed protein product [Leptidea sinapis]